MVLTCSPSSAGDVAALGWWNLFVNFGIGECFAFLVSTKWYNPRIHGNGEITESSSLFIRYEDWGSSLDRQQSGLCNLQNTGAGVLFTAYRLVEKLAVLLYSGQISERYSAVASKAQDCFGFLDRGSRLPGWWSIDETSREEQDRIYYDGSSKYKTFSPDVVKKTPRAALAKEICRLQAALTEQTDVPKFGPAGILCRVCFEEQINVILLPCRHHIICSTCRGKCSRCPVCRVAIEKGMPLHDL